MNKINETSGNDVAKALDPVSVAIEAERYNTKSFFFKHGGKP